MGHIGPVQQRYDVLPAPAFEAEREFWTAQAGDDAPRDEPAPGAVRREHPVRAEHPA